MKKRWKIFWIVCAVLACTGILLVTAGAALGGLTMLRSSKDERFIESVLDRLGIGIRTEVTYTSDSGFLPDLSEDGSYVPGEPDGELITAWEGVGELNLDLGGLGVIAIPYEGSEILVDLSGLRSDLRSGVDITQNGGELEVTAENRNWNTNDGSMIYISIPRGTYFDSVSANVGAGFLELSGISAGEISMNVGAGQIIAEDMTAEDVEAYCSAGQITMSGEVMGDADIECSLGEVLFTTPGTQDMYNYELTCGMGELVVGNETYSGLSNALSLDNGSDRTITADCAMGRIEVLYE